jgi:hypothetical protein
MTINDLDVNAGVNLYLKDIFQKWLTILNTPKFT